MNSGHTLFFRASASCSKILNVKSIFRTEKIFRANSVLRASASCSKILKDKKYFNAVKILGKTLFFRASANCSNILNVKKYISYSEKFQGKLCIKIYIRCSEFRAHSVFQGKCKLLKNPER